MLVWPQEVKHLVLDVPAGHVDSHTSPFRRALRVVVSCNRCSSVCKHAGQRGSSVWWEEEIHEEHSAASRLLTTSIQPVSAGEWRE